MAQNGSRQGDSLGAYLFLEEQGGAVVKFVGGFACVVLAGTVAGEALAHFCVALKIVLEAGGDVLPLGDERDA